MLSGFPGCRSRMIIPRTKESIRDCRFYCSDGHLTKVFDLAMVATIAGTTAKTFEWFEAGLSDRGKQVISNWLQIIPASTKFDNWSTEASKLIDRVFGGKPLSFRFLGRSSLASLVALCIVLVICFRLNLDVGRVPGDSYFLDYSAIAAMFVIINLVPDYLSLLVSRAIVRLMARAYSTRRILSLLLLDTTLTIIVASFGVFLGALVINCMLQVSGGTLNIRDARDAVDLAGGDFLSFL